MLTRIYSATFQFAIPLTKSAIMIQSLLIFPSLRFKQEMTNLVQ